jgi:hypothetical protein
VGSPRHTLQAPDPQAAIGRFSGTVTIASALLSVVTFIAGSALPQSWVVPHVVAVVLGLTFGIVCVFRWTQLSYRARAVQTLDAERKDFRSHIHAESGVSAAAQESARRFQHWTAHTFELLYGPDVAFRLFGNRHVAIRMPVHEGTPVSVLGSGLDRYGELTWLPNSHYEKPPYPALSKRYLELEPTNPKTDQRLGYHFVRLVPQGGLDIVCAGVSTWEDNHATSHVLEYELYLAFRRGKGRYFASRADALRELPLRTAASVDSISALYTGVDKAFRPLLSVQALVVTRRRAPDSPWGVLVWRRSQTVAVRRGWYQFPPSGAFETLNLSEGSLSRWIGEQCSSEMALAREFVEEVLGDKRLENARAMSRNEFYERPSVRRIRSAFADGVAKSRYLGLVIDPVAFRPELTFLIVIDDVWDWKPGREGVEMLDVIPLSDLHKVFADRSVDLNPGSAAMLAMALRCGALEDYGINDGLARTMLTEKTYERSS